MQDTKKRGKIVGASGLMVLLAPCAVFWISRSALPARYDPRLLLAIILSSSGAAVVGIIAGRMDSNWWHILAGAGFVTAAVLLAGIAV
jgi:hypothetical protein